jgi:hypothetical protein
MGKTSFLTPRLTCVCARRVVRIFVKGLEIGWETGCGLSEEDAPEMEI